MGTGSVYAHGSLSGNANRVGDQTPGSNGRLDHGRRICFLDQNEWAAREVWAELDVGPHEEAFGSPFRHTGGSNPL